MPSARRETRKHISVEAITNAAQAIHRFMYAVGNFSSDQTRKDNPIFQPKKVKQQRD